MDQVELMLFEQGMNTNHLTTVTKYKTLNFEPEIKRRMGNFLEYERARAALIEFEIDAADKVDQPPHEPADLIAAELLLQDGRLLLHEGIAKQLENHNLSEN
jgi:putative hemolysin